jgi:hypothetical protein
VSDSRLRFVNVEQAYLQGEDKDVLSFADERERLVCNKPDGRILARAFSPETDLWCGRSERQPHD